MTPTATDIQIYNDVVNAGYPAVFAQLVVGQAREESGNYTNAEFNQDNNPFGMTYPGQTGAAQQGNLQPDGNGSTYYAYYPNGIDDAVADLLQWHVNRQNQGAYNISDLTTPQAYAMALYNNDYYEGGIAVEQDYAANIQSIDNSLYGNSSPNAAVSPAASTNTSTTPFSGQIVPGISNTALIIVGAIVAWVVSRD